MNRVLFSKRFHIFNFPVTVLITFCVSMIFFGCGSFDTNETDFAKAHLEGMIYDYHNNPCAGVEISVDNTPASVSDVNGRFTLYNLSRGNHTVRISKKEE